MTTLPPTSSTGAACFMRGIPAHLIDQMWHFAEPYVKRALDHCSGEFLPSDIKEACKNRSIQLWLINRDNRVIAAITTEIVVYPNRKHCRIITLAGANFDDWLVLVDTTLAAWAAEQGCVALESFVRKGLVPRMAPHGYKYKHAILVKELDHG